MSQQHLSYIVKCRQFDIDSLNLTQQQHNYIKSLKEARTAKFSVEEKEELFAFLTQLVAQHKKTDVISYLLIMLIESQQRDLRLSVQFISSGFFHQFYDHINIHCQASEDSQQLFQQFLSVFSRLMTPENSMYQAAYQTFSGLVKTIPEQSVTKTKINAYVMKFTLINQFLRNEWFIVNYFTGECTKQAYQQFYAGTAVVQQGTVKPFLNLLQELLKTFHPTLLYQVYITIWILSFQGVLQQQLVDSGLIGLLVRSLSMKNIQQNSKLIRSICLILNNLKTNSEAIRFLITLSGQRLLQQLSTLTWPQDSQIEQTLNEVLATIQQTIVDTSTIQRYKLELGQSTLEMTPLHTNHAFWKANIQSFVADQAIIMRKLIAIGQEALEKDDRHTLTVVLNDFGMFVQYHPQGRDWVEKLPGMLSISMSCLKVEDEQLQAQAIQTVSKLLLNKVV